jgi:hypothetical protein
MAQMDDAQWRGFVLAGIKTGKLGVTRANGQPVSGRWAVFFC